MHEIAKTLASRDPLPTSPGWPALSSQPWRKLSKTVINRLCAGRSCWEHGSPKARCFAFSANTIFRSPSHELAMSLRADTTSFSPHQFQLRRVEFPHATATIKNNERRPEHVLFGEANKTPWPPTAISTNPSTAGSSADASRNKSSLGTGSLYTFKLESEILTPQRQFNSSQNVPKQRMSRPKFPIRPAVPKSPAAEQCGAVEQMMQPTSTLSRSQRNPSDAVPTLHLVSLKELGSDLEKLAKQTPWSGASADRASWRGCDEEDLLTEQNIKNGYSNKSSALSSEHTSARLSLWPNLKHQGGLQTLSAAFVSALQGRSENGAISSCSTFKLPPRVTLTDSKRESWLKDLANQSIPLRRLSRTIPHGIRGKALLDHCLSKAIPVSRAIWLVKCVGANEIRASKRKSAGCPVATFGESKWIKEWTAQVQLFLESLCHDATLSQSTLGLRNGLHLTSRIILEQLVDTEAFSDWLVARLNNQEDETLLPWLNVVDDLWSVTVAYHHRGSKLLDSLLRHMEMDFVEDDETEMHPLHAICSTMACRLLQDRPGCFLTMHDWEAHAPTLAFVTSKSQPLLAPALKSLSERNVYLRDQRRLLTPLEGVSEERLLLVLNSWNPQCRFKDFLPEVFEICAKVKDAAFVISQWATSPYRVGKSHIYLAARLTRQLLKKAIDIDQLTLALLSQLSRLGRKARRKAYLLFYELIRSKHMSPSRIFQWMISGCPVIQKPSSGLCKVRDLSYDDTNDRAPFQAATVQWELIEALPDSCLPRHVRNLRSCLASDICYPLEQEEIEVRKFLFVFESHLSESRPYTSKTVPSLSSLELPRFASTRPSIALGIRHRLRIFLSEAAGNGMYTPLSSIYDLEELFPVIADCIEFMAKLQDFPLLVDVLMMALPLASFQLLTLILGHVNCDLESFSAIGAAEALANAALARFSEIYSHTDATDIRLLQLLLDITTHLPGFVSTSQELDEEIARLRVEPAFAACSPVSEDLSQQVQTSVSLCQEDIENLLESGNMMEPGCFEAAFKHLAADVSRNLGSGFHDLTRPAELLTKLHLVDSHLYRSLCAQWLEHLLQRGTVPHDTAVLAALVEAEIFELDFVMEELIIIHKRLAALESQKTIHWIILALTLDIRHFELFTYRPCRFEYRRADLFHKQSPLIIEALRETLPYLSVPELRSSAFVDSLREGLLRIATNSPEDFHALVTRAMQTEVALFLLKGMMDIESDDYQSSSTLLAVILESVNRLSFSVVQPTLQLVLAADPELYGQLTQQLTGTESRFIFAIQRLPDVWRRITESLDEKIQCQLHREWSKELLRIVNHIVDGSVRWDISPAVVGQVNGLLTALDSVRAISEEDQVSQSFFSVLSVFLNIGPSLQSSNDMDTTAMSATNSAPALRPLLRYLLIYQDHFTTEKSSQALLCKITCQLARIWHDVEVQSFSVEILDVVTLLSTKMTSESRALCSHALSEDGGMLNENLRFLFGHARQPTNYEVRILAGDSLPEAQSLATSESAAIPRFTLDHNSFDLRKWEIIQETAPQVGENDCNLRLGVFGARNLMK